MSEDIDAMSFILKACRDKLRAENDWDKGNCRLSFGTTPISNGARWFVGLEEIGATNVSGSISEYDEYEYAIKVGIWRDSNAHPNDREGVLLEDEDLYLRDRRMLHGLETCVRRTLKQWAVVTCVNEYMAIASRPDCYPAVLSQLRMTGKSETSLITDIPSISISGGRWARRLLTFRGMRQIVKR